MAHAYSEFAIQFFDASCNLLAHASVERTLMDTTANARAELTVTGTMPTDTAVMQAVIAHWHCSSAEGADATSNCYDGNGAVHWDHL